MRRMEALQAASEHVELLEETLVEGVVKSIEGEEIIVSIGAGSEGALSLHELVKSGITPAVGDKVELFVEKKDSAAARYPLSKEKADRLRLWDRLVRAYEEQSTIEGVIVAAVEGGFSVDVGMKAFLPGSQVDLMPARDVDRYLEQKLEFRIVKFHKNRNNIVLSRRVLLEEERAKTLEKVNVGAILEGKVKNVTDYGAFIDLGGVQGLLHVSDMSWGRVGHPSEIVGVGDRVRVKVLKHDTEAQRISLGIRQLQEDPWLDAERRYAAGKQVKGTVISITDYGVFVELEQGVEGLVHTTGAVLSPADAKELLRTVSIGDAIEGVVLETDIAKKRISIGWKKPQT